jgi:trans-2,3-dihydro-3-hydroxyanthranilate isomerase
MKYAFHIVDLFSSAPFGGNQLAVLPVSHIYLFAGDLQDGGELYARMWAPAMGIEEDIATGAACAALVGAMASKPSFGGTAYRLSIQQGVLMGRRSEIEAEALKSGGVVTSVSVGGATAYVASGEIEVPRFALASWILEGAQSV